MKVFSGVFHPPELGCVLSLPGLPGGGSKTFDRSPYGHSCSIFGATWRRLPGGLWCLSFDGSDDYVDCGAPDSLNLTDMTIEVWVNPETPGGGSGTFRNVVAHGDYSSADMWALYNRDNDPDRFFFATRVGSGDYKLLEGTLGQPLGWLYVVATKVGSVGRLFINCQEVDSGASDEATENAAGTVQISSSGTRVLKGLVGGVRIHNRALSALEIQNHFDQGKHLFGVWR